MQRAILLVEDNPDDIELTLIGLQRTRLTTSIISIRDGAEALDYLRREGSYADRVDLDPLVVILDIKLPKVNGLEVLQAIRSDDRLRCLPVVMLTSSREQQDLLMSYQLGVNAYVTKPIGSTEFLDAVRDIGEFWGSLNEAPLLV